MRKKSAKRGFRSLLSLLLIVAMLLSLVPSSVLAAAGEETGGFLSQLQAAFTPVKITKIVPSYLSDPKNQDQIVSNELESFDPNKTEYDVIVKAGITLEGFTVDLSEPVTGVTIEAYQTKTDVTNKGTMTVSSEENTRYSTNNQVFRLEEWGKTVFTIKINYGTKVSPRYTTYKINYINEYKTDAELKSFDITAYSGEEKANPVEEMEPVHPLQEVLVVDSSTDSLVINAVPETEGSTMNLEYKTYEPGGTNRGTTTNVKVDANEPLTITKVHNEAFVKSMTQNRNPLNGQILKMTVTSPSGETRSIKKSVLIVDSAYDQFLNIAQDTSSANPTAKSGIFYQNNTDRKTGYIPAIKDYTVLLYDQSGGGKSVDNKLHLKLSRSSYSSPYIEFDGQKYNLDEDDPGYLVSKELQENKANKVELKVYKTVEYKEFTTYTFDVIPLPSVRIKAVAMDENTVIPGDGYCDISNANNRINIMNGADHGTLRFEFPENATLNVFGKDLDKDNNVVSTNNASGWSRMTLTVPYYLDDDPIPYTYQISSGYSVRSIQLTTGLNYIDYFPAHGQFVNSASWGVMPDDAREDLGVSLGGYGGYMIAKFKDPVKNDPKNVSGIDLTLAGNAFPGSSEPGNVYVSKDGVDWYSLAGGEHYNDYVTWDYQMTYENDDPQNNATKWSDNYGGSGELGTNSYHEQCYYPLTENYGKYRTPENAALNGNDFDNGVIPSKYTVGGVQLPGNSDTWGYVDGSRLDRNNSGPGDEIKTAPYQCPLNGSYTKFDLDWAVDTQGNPVHLDEISYVKIQTASNLIHPAFGEASTEVTNIADEDITDENTKRTPVAEKIVVNGQAITIDPTDAEDGKVEAKVNYISPDDKIDVKVTIPNGVENSAAAPFTTIINDKAGTSRTFDAVPKHQKIRIITQDNKSTPMIYYITLEQSAEYTALELDKEELALSVGGEEAISASLKGKIPGNKTIVWTGANEAIATVDNQGKVKGIAVGETVVTAVNEETGARATAKVVVGDLVESITPAEGTPEENLVKIGETLTLSANYAPAEAVNGKLIWTSADEKTAVVDSVTADAGSSTAIIKGVNSGETTVTASSSNGKTATYKVIVPAKDKETAIISVEKLTIDQGYVIEPLQVVYEKGDTADKVITDTLKANGFSYTNTGKIGASFYLSTIEGADSAEEGKLDEEKVPANVREMAEFADKFSGENVNYPDLGEFSYSSQGGWIYQVNDRDPSVGMDSYTVKDGDVIRLQFSLVGLGADLGHTSMGGTPAAVAKKSALVSRLADWQAYPDEFLTIQKNLETYEYALTVAANHAATQEEVDEAAAALGYEAAVPVTGLEVSAKTVGRGETTAVDAVVTPDNATDKTLTYTSSDEAIATVDKDGTITGIAAGTAEITVLSVGNAIGQPPLTKSLTVTVEASAQDKADAVIALIDALGEISLDSEAAVTDARTAYDGLDNDDIRALVTNYDVLKTAEARLAELKEAKAVADGLAAEITGLKPLAEITLADRDIVYNLKERLDSLTADQSPFFPPVSRGILAKYVEKMDGLVAEAQYAERQALKVQDMINGLLDLSDEEFTLGHKADVIAARLAYDALSEEQQELIPEAEDGLAALDARIAALEATAEAQDKIDALKEKIAALPVGDEITRNDGKSAEALNKILAELQEEFKDDADILAQIEAIDMTKVVAVTDAVAEILAADDAYAADQKTLADTLSADTGDALDKTERLAILTAYTELEAMREHDPDRYYKVAAEVRKAITDKRDTVRAANHQAGDHGVTIADDDTLEDHIAILIEDHDEETLAALKEALAGGETDVEDIILSYNIRLWNLREDKEHQLAEGQSLSFTVDAGQDVSAIADRIRLAHHQTDGSIEFIRPIKVDGQLVTFQASSFSPYSLVTLAQGTTDPGTDPTTPTPSPGNGSAGGSGAAGGSGSGSGSATKTGDQTNLPLYFLLLTLSGVALVVLKRKVKA